MRYRQVSREWDPNSNACKGYQQTTLVGINLHVICTYYLRGGDAVEIDRSELIIRIRGASGGDLEHSLIS